ncbi:MAG TPA: diadenylate cyclase, partial [Chroococcales cyanobacterium]
EMSHLVASLSTVDGAVVLTRRFELLGFGAEIFCDRAELIQVARALNLDGSKTIIENMQGVGTRHRAAYRLCNAMKEALVIVVSQDGNIRAMKWQDKYVTYWDHEAATSSFAL